MTPQKVKQHTSTKLENSSLCLRWIFRYKLFFFIGFLIFGMQVFLIFKSSGLFQSISIRTYNLAASKSSASNSRVFPVDAFDDEDLHSNSNVFAKTNDVSINERRLNRSAQYLKDLDFVPSCDIGTNKEAVSALHRARTMECKRQIVETVCNVQRGTFYPKSLPNSCPSGNFTANLPLGCYKDEKNFRVLASYFLNFKTSNTPEKCIQLCLQSGFQYAGVQYSSECFCGNDEPPATAKLPDSSCNMKCSGDPKQICGGYYTLNVYETGTKKFQPQAAELTSENSEQKVKIVFLLTLNGRAVRQVHRLIKAIYSKNHFYYIHVDSRQDYLYRELIKLEANFINIKLARHRFSTIWGGASLLTMLLQSMTELLQSQWDWDFVINLSESDFPVKTIGKLEEFVIANAGKNFVKSHGREVQRFIQKQGLDKTFIECDMHMWRVGDRELPAGIQIDGGSDWVGLSRNFVEYVTAVDRDPLVEGLLVLFRHTLLPAESFFHTVIRNSKFCDTYIDNNLHVTNWKRKLGCKCQYKHVVDWCGCSPNDFKSDDWPRLQATEKKQLFFARKFEPIVHQAVILQLEEWLFGPYQPDFPNLNNYWQSVYHHEDLASSGDPVVPALAEAVIRIDAATNRLAYTTVKVLELTNYMQLDMYRGFLIRHQVQLGGADTLLELETWVRVNQTAQVSKSNALARRITFLEVSSDYDQKEQIGRNYAKILGPSSEPVLIFRVSGSQSENITNYNLTVVFLDPRGKVADISDLNIEDAATTTVHYVKSALEPPLAVGMWSVKILNSKKSPIGLCNFLVTPSSSSNNNNNNEITNTNLKLASSDTKDNEPNQLAIKELDNLILSYFIVKESCLVRNANVGQDVSSSSLAKLVDCQQTEWSSMAADPKSDVLLELYKS